MKQLVLQLQAHPTFAKVWHWVKLIAITGGAQAVVQATGLLSGILIIRLLPVEEYALYTLANTMLGTMTVLADGGISAGVMAEGGKVWRDKEKLGIVIATGLDLRRKFAIGSLLVSIPILVYLLQNHGASGLMTLLIIASLIPAFFAALSDSLLQVAPKLHQEIVPLQKNQMTVSVIRLLLSGLTLFIFPWTFVALLANGIPRVYGNIQLRKINEGFIENTESPSIEIKKEILKIVYRVLPGAIYYCLSGQIIVWLLSIFGTTVAIAQIGALGRVTMLLNVFSILAATIITPHFARITSNVQAFFFKTTGVTSIFVIIIVYLCSVFSNEILYLLGEQYKNLNYELVLIILGGGVNFMAGFSFGLSSSRGWVIKPVISISTSLLSILVGIFLFDNSTLIGVLYFNLLLSGTQYLLNTFYCYYKTRSFAT
ncbi:polysaccharide biosynthesis protein [Runella sp. MFBS21]|uniref:polysaccharide biosynthesis protein n=1 Tax=Runella sp. MFBS21 TaxID=3034018 RepID=UPI0023FA2883|nr:polysaccharide biosynthesis protein [Runella sp. MFBS21]MDF7820395.1 polysaccharide biosynthesis protein [Runella sp. MFBS21]